jgi:hypothetical protein
MNPGPDAAQWYADELAILALVVSGIGVVVNSLIAYYAVGQFRAAKTAADSARESVGEAQKSAQLAKDALEIGNRAWVHVSKIDPHASSPHEVAQNKEIMFRPDVVLKNYGTTPATTFMAETSLQLLADFPTTEQLQFQVTDQNGLSVVSPGNEFWVMSTPIRISLDDWHLVTSGKIKLVLFGRAYYEDIFGKPHKSTWLYWYESEKAGGFIPGPFHNYVT